MVLRVVLKGSIVEQACLFSFRDTFTAGYFVREFQQTVAYLHLGASNFGLAIIISFGLDTAHYASSFFVEFSWMPSVEANS